MQSKFILLTLFSLLVVQAVFAVKSKHPETYFDFVDYVKHFNYPVETHIIQTNDGYLLTYFRIQKKNSTIQSDLPVLFMQHGFLDSSDTFIVNSEPEENAPAFYFANRGYDVWLGNSRGNKYSLNHTNLSAQKDSKFWEFSWSQMAEEDLPAAFDYINNKTGQLINYMGHSQGTTMMFAALSENQKSIDKYLRRFIALGPVAYVGHQSSTLITVIKNLKVASIANQFGIDSLFLPNWLQTKLSVFLCRYVNYICTNGMLRSIADTDPSIDSTERMDVIMGHFPAGTSIRNLQHWMEGVANDKFEKYDFGAEGNMEHYGTHEAPTYNLNNIVNKTISLYVGTQDKLANPTDCRRLKSELEKTSQVKYQELPKGHATFIWGKDMSYLKNVLKDLE